MSAKHLIEKVEIRIQIVGMSQLLKAARQQLLARIAQKVAEPLIDPEKGTVRRHVRNADRRLLERSAETLLAGIQRRFGLTPPGQVADAHDPRRPALVAYRTRLQS